MRVLVAVVGKEEDLHRARRHLGYQGLVLVAPQGKGQRLAGAAGLAPAPRVVEVPEHDLLACLERVDALLAELQLEEVRVAVDGGTLAMTMGALLACLAQGVEAWFLEHTAVRLPGLRALPVERRFTEEQARVLAALEGKLPALEVARRAGLDEAQAKRVLLALRRAGAVATDAGGAELTAVGQYYRRALRGRT